MKLKNTLCAAAATLGLIGASPAWAQVQDNVPAVVTLALPGAGLEVTGEQSLNFGTVAIPTASTSAPNPQCFYTMGDIAAMQQPTFGVEQISASGGATINGPVTPAGCQWLDTSSARLAVFKIQCVSDAQVFWELSSTSGPIPGLGFDHLGRISGVPIPPTFFGNGFVNGENTDSDRGVFPCSSTQDGFVFAYVGGRIDVSTLAQVGTEVTAGTIVFAANY